MSTNAPSGDSLPEDHPILEFTRGDAALAARLKNNLRTLADSTDDPRLREALLEILAGRASVRSLASNDALGNLIKQRVDPVVKERMASLDPAQLAALQEKARLGGTGTVGAELEAIRQRLLNRSQ